jgi:hypothetical protein
MPSFAQASQTLSVLALTSNPAQSQGEGRCFCSFPASNSASAEQAHCLVDADEARTVGIDNRPAAAAPERLAAYAFILPRGLGTDFS